MLYHSHTESIAGSTSSGFGAGGQMVFGCGCQPEKLLTPLYKETYLSEFLTDTDKKNARMNLGITADIDISDVKDQLKKEILKELGNSQGGTQDPPSKDDPGSTDGDQEQIDNEFDEKEDGKEYW